MARELGLDSPQPGQVVRPEAAFDKRASRGGGIAAARFALGLRTASARAKESNGFDFAVNTE